MKYIRNIKKFAPLFMILGILLLNQACASKAKEEDSRPPEQLYSDAMSNMKKQNYKKSAELFSQIAYKYPYYKWAAKSQVMEIYSYYLLKEYDNAIATIEIFVKTHPAYHNISYVYYLKALSYYDQIDSPHRDQSVTAEAKRAFLDLIGRFPDSEYAKDAKVKLELIEDHLAAQEMIVGRYYLEKGNIVAAINRFKNVVDEYPTTSHIEEALYRLTEAYTFLGLKDEAQKYASVLGHNYPNSKWYKESYKLLEKGA